jgi:hypothetical protein
LFSGEQGFWRKIVEKYWKSGLKKYPHESTGGASVDGGKMAILSILF